MKQLATRNGIAAPVELLKAMLVEEYEARW